MRPWSLISLLALVLLAAASHANAAPSTQPTITLSVVTEEGEKLIRATVQVNSKPVEDAAVRFYVKRTFGNLLLGEDKTLDDGTAAVHFPKNLPGGTTGQFEVIAEIKAPPEYAARVQQIIDGGIKIEPVADPFPRALWAPNAPLVLVVTILVLLGGVWTTYIFVISQILAIRKGVKA